MLSVIIPTYNERDNVRPLMERLFRVLGRLDMASEVIVVDDDSPDRTWEVAQGFKVRGRLRVMRRDGTRGLSSAVLDGVGEAKGGLLCVMDADLSHPPEAIPEMLDRLGGNDIVIASRHVPGGSLAGWPLSRRALSRGAIALARPLTTVRDPLSGFFIANRGIVEVSGARPWGFKILLELIVRSKSKRLAEVPYRFSCRERGRSKLGFRSIWGYVFQLLGLYVNRVIR